MGRIGQKGRKLPRNVSQLLVVSPKSDKSLRTVLLFKKRQKGGREVVPKAAQRFGELGPVYRPRPISVEMPEDVLPVLDVLPEPSEFCGPSGRMECVSTSRVS